MATSIFAFIQVWNELIIAYILPQLPRHDRLGDATEVVRSAAGPLILVLPAAVETFGSGRVNLEAAADLLVPS